jgi:branched-chain amino acid transport system permease protein
VTLLEEVLFAGVNGIIFGSLLALAAVGLSLVFGVLEVPNFAQGEFATLAGFTTIGLMGLGLGLLPSAAVALAVTLLVGVVVERFVIAKLYGREEFLLLSFFVTFGFVIISESLLRTVFGGFFQIEGPSLGLVRVAGANLNVLRIVAGVLAGALLLALYVFTRRTYAGLAMRAVASDRDGARMVGIDPARVYTLTFGLGALLTGVTGVLYGMLFTLYPTLGVRLTAFAFTIVVLGGVGSFPGAVAASLLIGLIDSFTASFIGSRYRFFAVFAVLFLVLAIRPGGISGGVDDRF